MTILRAISAHLKRIDLCLPPTWSFICERRSFTETRYANGTLAYTLKLIQFSAASELKAMITKHITEVTTRFNPFTKPSKTCRVFLAHLPANARTTMKINTTVLQRDSKEPSFLKLRFSACSMSRRLGPILSVSADQSSL